MKIMEFAKKLANIEPSKLFARNLIIVNGQTINARMDVADSF